MSKIKWGVIGPGNIADQVVNDLQDVADMEVLAVASRSFARGKEFASKYAIPLVFDNYEALYTCEDIDAIYIATPHNFHFQQSLNAIQAGKAVVCEKPITTNVEDFKRLKAAAASHDVYLMEALWMYFLPAIRTAVQWVQAGRIGAIKGIHSDFGFKVPFDAQSRMYNPDLAGGVLLDMGIYPVAIANLFLGPTPSEIQVSARKAPTQVDTDVCTLLTYDSATAMIHTSFESRLPNLTTIIGEEGMLNIQDCWGAKEVTLSKDGAVVDTYTDEHPGRGFHYEFAAVVEDLKNGRMESEIMPHQQSLDLQQLMDAIKTQFWWLES